MSKFSKIIALMLALCMAAAMTAAAPAAFADEGAYDLSGCKPVNIMFPITNAPEYLETKCTEYWMDLVTERSNGLITFNYTNGGALGTQMELLEGIQYGTYDLSIIDLANFSEFVPEAKVLGMPCLIKDYDHADKIFSGEVFEWLQKIMEENSNILVLNTYYCGFRYVFANKDISTLDKCKGVLIRSPQVELYTDTLGMLGFSTVAMSFPECYTGMSTGIIDAIEQPLQPIYTNGFYELGKDILSTRHFLSTNHIIANKDFWNGLPEVYRDIMLDAMEEVQPAQWQGCKDAENGFVEKLEAEGVVFHEFTEEDRAAVDEMFYQYWTDKCGELGDEVIGILDTVIALSK